MEEWRDIEGYEGFYQVSTHGRIKSLARTITCKNGMLKPFKERILTPHFNTNGYLWVHLQRNSVKEFWFIHRLVARAFVPNPDNKPFVNHKSGRKTDNVADLLEWSTRRENVAHAFSTGLMSHAGEKNSQSKLTVDKVVEMRRLFTEGVTRRELSDRFGVSYSRVRDVVNGTCWTEAKCA